MNKTDAINIINILKNTYPEATCSLDFTTPFEMVVSVMLSAQCTDARVNQITPELFKICKTISDYANIDINELESIIMPCGFYQNKAKNIKLTANKILNDFNGQVPDNMDDLLSLPGIGRKSANVIMLEVFNNPQGIAVDTHAKRISNLIGLSEKNDPDKIEEDLLALFPKEFLKDVNHLLVWHGRYTCIARHPQCHKCTIKKYCQFYKDIIERL